MADPRPDRAPSRTVAAARRGWAAVALAVAVAVVTVGPVAWRPEPTGDANLDRLLGGLVAGTVLALVYPQRRIAVAAGLVAAVAGFEVAQRLAPGRDAGTADALVKIAGGLLAVAAVAAAEVRSPRGVRYSAWRGAAAGGAVAVFVAGLAGWVLVPPAAVRRALAADAALCPAVGRAPTIDIWNHRPAAFDATVRNPGRPGCVLAFRLAGRSWRLESAGDRPPRRPAEPQRLPLTATDSGSSSPKTR